MYATHATCTLSTHAHTPPLHTHKTKHIHKLSTPAYDTQILHMQHVDIDTSMHIQHISTDTMHHTYRFRPTIHEAHT